MRVFAAFLATMVAAFSGTAVVALYATNPTYESVSHGWVIVLMGLTGILTFMVANLGVGAVGVRLKRGPGYVAWVRPHVCRSFDAWLFSDWRFNSTGGLQDGMRVFGVEVAFSGKLD